MGGANDGEGESGMINSNFLENFAVESNHIEGITGSEKRKIHVEALGVFLLSEAIGINELRIFVAKVQPGASYRPDSGDEVSVGGRHCLSYRVVQPALTKLLMRVNSDEKHPNTLHLDYEVIHPFSDGNGRSGRALWLWQMHKLRGYAGSLKFLHMYYYGSFERHEL